MKSKFIVALLCVALLAVGCGAKAKSEVSDSTESKKESTEEVRMMKNPNLSNLLR